MNNSNKITLEKVFLPFRTPSLSKPYITTIFNWNTGMSSSWDLLRCIHHFKSDLINIMDHMRITCNGPLAVILGHNSLKVENGGPKVPKQADAKRDGVINPMWIIVARSNMNVLNVN